MPAREPSSNAELKLLMMMCSEEVADRVRTRVARSARRLLITLSVASSLVASYDLFLWLHVQ